MERSPNLLSVVTLEKSSGPVDGNYLEKKNAAQYKEHLAGLFQQCEFNCGLEDNTES